MSRSIARSSLILFGSSTSILLVTFIYTPVLVRIIGKSGYGQLATLLAVYSILVTIVTTGFYNSTRKHLSQYSIYGKREVSTIASVSLVLALIIALVTLTTGLALVGSIAVTHLWEQELIVCLGIILVVLCLFTLFETCRGIMLGLHEEKRIEPVRVLHAVLYAGVALLFAYLGFGVVGVLAGMFCGTFVALAVGIALLRRRVKLSFHRAKKGLRRHSRKILSFGGFSVIGVLLAQSLYHADVLLVRYFWTPADVGVYKAALVTAQVLWIFPMSIQTALLHNIPELWEKGDRKKIAELTSRLVKYTFLLSCLFGVGLIVLAEPFLQVYFGPGFLSGALPTRVLLLGTICFSMARIMGPVLEGTVLIKYHVAASAVVAISNVVLNYILIPIYGILGAAIATTLAYSSKIVTNWWGVRKLQITPFSKFKLGRLTLFLLLYTCALVALYYIILTPLLQLLIIAPIAFLLFILLISRLEILTKKELLDLGSAFPKPISRIFRAIGRFW